MEALKTLAQTIVSLLFLEASKETGKMFGKNISEQASKIRKAISSKFNKKEEELANISPVILEQQLLALFKEDDEFANYIKSLVGEAALEKEKKVVLEKTKGKGKLTIEKIKQERLPSSSHTTQIIGSELEIDGDISISDVSQK